VIIRRHRIEVFHYWVALGPIHRIGMGLCHGRCRAIVTIHDLGVAFWRGVPFLEHVRATPYWRMQKLLLRRIHLAVCNSQATAIDLSKLSPRLGGRTTVVYPPLEPPVGTVRGSREPYFITLGGAPNKNLDTVLRAFAAFQKAHPEYQLRVLGEIDREEEIHAGIPDGILFESMQGYTQHLNRSSGLVFCSRNEGLGLPPLEAMSRGCPLLLSDIAPHRETTGAAAYFASPDSAAAITDGMEELAANRDTWEKRALHGWEAYTNLAGSSLSDFNAYFSHEERLSL
jgi:glycosyltransferase involved in cell wall biosynthesis